MHILKYGFVYRSLSIFYRLLQWVLLRRKIRDTSLFDRDFYLSQLAGGKWSYLPRLFPIFHYFLIGHKKSFNPSQEFNTEWYCLAYPDVAKSGICPLAHYIAYGCYEGRLPHSGASTPYIEISPAVSETEWLSHKLWQGFPHLAEQSLRQWARSQGDAVATLALASWSYAQNRVDETLEWLESPAFRGKSEFNPRRLRGLVKCYSLMGRVQPFASFLSRPDVVNALGADASYARANATTGINEHLAPINELFGKRGLVPIEANGELALPLLQPAWVPELNMSGYQGVGHSLPLISVILPAYNAGPDLAVALDSLLRQTWPALEILVVDDASSDDTGEWAKNYAKRDKRIRYLRNERNLGAYPTRNRGLAAAKGEFVTVHDSDDWSHPQKLESQVRPLLNDNTLAASVSHWVRVTHGLQFVGSWMMGNGFVELNASSWLIRRHWLKKLGGWDAVNVGADSEFSQRLEYCLGRKSLCFLWPDTPLAFARVGSGTLTRTSSTHLRTLFYGLRRLYSEAARWWLRESAGIPVMTQKRPFPVPLGNVRFGKTDPYDCVIAGNFALRGVALSELMDKLKSVSERQDIRALCMLHWPDYHAWHTNTIADDVFAFCQERGLNFAHAGITLHVKEVILLDFSLWQKPPTENLRIEGLEKVTQVDGSLCEDQSALCDYFRRGGVAQEV